MKQQQFLEVLDRDEAERRWREIIDAAPLGDETVLLERALGRVLAEMTQCSATLLARLTERKHDIFARKMVGQRFTRRLLLGFRISG